VHYVPDEERIDRVVALLLRLAARTATRGRKASSMLALAQLDRAPRPAARLLLLLQGAAQFVLELRQQ